MRADQKAIKEFYDGQVSINDKRKKKELELKKKEHEAIVKHHRDLNMLEYKFKVNKKKYLRSIYGDNAKDGAKNKRAQTLHTYGNTINVKTDYLRSN